MFSYIWAWVDQKNPKWIQTCASNLLYNHSTLEKNTSKAMMGTSDHSSRIMVILHFCRQSSVVITATHCICFSLMPVCSHFLCYCMLSVHCLAHVGMSSVLLVRSIIFQVFPPCGILMFLINPLVYVVVAVVYDILRHTVLMHGELYFYEKLSTLLVLPNLAACHMCKMPVNLLLSFSVSASFLQLEDEAHLKMASLASKAARWRAGDVHHQDFCQACSWVGKPKAEVLVGAQFVFVKDWNISTTCMLKIHTCTIIYEWHIWKLVHWKWLLNEELHKLEKAFPAENALRPLKAERLELNCQKMLQRTLMHFTLPFWRNQVQFRYFLDNFSCVAFQIRFFQQVNINWNWGIIITDTNTSLIVQCLGSVLKFEWCL